MFIVFIIGLPGSGKTYLLNTFPDDFHKVDDPTCQDDFIPKHGEQKIVIAHPHLCDTDSLNSLKIYLMSLFKENIQFKHLNFILNEQQCIKNSLRQDRGNNKEVINYIKLLSSMYYCNYYPSLLCYNENMDNYQFRCAISEVKVCPNCYKQEIRNTLERGPISMSLRYSDRSIIYNKDNMSLTCQRCGFSLSGYKTNVELYNAWLVKIIIKEGDKNC